MPKSKRASPHGEGYVMLYRKSLTSAAFQDEKTWKVWSWCVLRANWQGLPLDYSGEQITLKRGQFYTGTFSMIGELRMSKSTAWRHLRKLENWGNVGIETRRGGTVITVLNYDAYQDATRSEFIGDGTEMGNEREMNGKITGNEREQIKKVISKEPKKEGSYIAQPESIESVRNYFLELGESDDSAGWWDHFSAVGWVVGKARSPIRDWKATVRTWIRNGKKWGTNGTTNRNSGGRSGSGSPNKAVGEPGKYAKLSTTSE
jgi:hypothetical protein